MKILSPDAGSDAWWRTVALQGTPLIAPAGPGQSHVTFLWRDPAGQATSSLTRQVWLNITGITDHHSGTEPRSLERLPGTNIWHTTLMLSNRWRGSYTLIPDITGDKPASDLPLSERRQWWQSQFRQAQSDPLNLAGSWKSARGHWVSALHMPAAPPQEEWQAVKQEQEQEQEQEWLHLDWHSRLLNNHRRISALSTGNRSPATRPLVILLDGEFWLTVMPLAPPLYAMTHRGTLPEAVYLFIDSVSTAQRSEELPCNGTFWQAVMEELLPLVRHHWSFSTEAVDTVVVGQSFGGLSALYAVLNWPQRFGCALSQSGSFWWPDRSEDNAQRPGELTRQLARGIASGHRLRIAMDAGLHEEIILQANRQMVPLLQQAGHQIRYLEVEGGHDALCWRGGITDGLRWLWSTLPAGK